MARRFSLALLESRTRNWLPRQAAGTTVVFAPHYDDETLGAGGTIIKLRQHGVPVHLVFMTDGSTSHARAMDGAVLSALRREESLCAAAVLGVQPNHVRFLEFPEKRLAQYRAEAVQRVVELLTDLRCERVFIPATIEPLIWSSDHQQTTEIALEALERTQLRPEVMEYLVWFWYHWPWVPVMGSNDARQLLKLTWQNAIGAKAWLNLNTAVGIADVSHQKREALEEYKTQMTRVVSNKPWPILADVAQGEFLENSFQSREFFKSYIYQARSN
jgi:LmbE family N-acetylglucosaminyl deacetylase